MFGIVQVGDTARAGDLLNEKWIIRKEIKAILKIQTQSGP